MQEENKRKNIRQRIYALHDGNFISTKKDERGGECYLAPGCGGDLESTCCDQMGLGFMMG